MTKKIVNRVLVSIPVLIGVILIIYVMLNVIPGNPIEVMMAEHARQDVIDRISAYYGLDKPVWEQFLIYLNNLLHGDLGVSYKLNRSVNSLIADAFPYTLKLAIAAALVSWIIGIPAGILSAIRENTIVDRLFMGFSLLGISLPVFMAAMFLQYIFAFQLKWVPISGTDSWAGFILPAIALGWNSAGQVAQMTRTTLLETLQEDYIDTARAKGRGPLGVLIHHAFRNAMLPVLTMMTVQFSGLLSGAVITETVFSINGIGRLMVQAISGRDIPLLQGTALLATTVVILGSLLADSLYSVLDPRIRKEG